jgi:hypothetical protein
MRDWFWPLKKRIQWKADRKAYRAMKDGALLVRDDKPQSTGWPQGIHTSQEWRLRQSGVLMVQSHRRVRRG